MFERRGWRVDCGEYEGGVVEEPAPVTLFAIENFVRNHLPAVLAWVGVVLLLVAVFAVPECFGEETLP